MDQHEFNQLMHMHDSPSSLVIHVSDVLGPDRTLVYGYTIDRNTFHAYKKDNELVVVIYDYGGNLIFRDKGSALEADVFVPSKRAYPERCDYPFALILRSYNVHLPFTVYRPDVVPGAGWLKRVVDADTFYGKTFD